MLDIKFVREHQDVVAQAMKNRNGSWDSDAFNELDESRRSFISEEEGLQARRNAASKEIGRLMREGKNEEAEAAKESVRVINEKIAEASAKRDEAERALTELLSHVPNLPSDTTPVGKDETENPEIRRWGGRKPARE